MEKQNKNQNEQIKKAEDASEKGAFVSTTLFVGGFIFLLYIALYLLFMSQANI